ncbi:diphosphate--fructose-6-phosphate 1-phosphotransferase [Sorangium cellulosum]|uniref:ATP-dependent 6-phosphofructokinase n=1 Tax=Sorangium cellulosum TaxID=56 RepID=A0A150S702_SORCE|nr:diphosphate--fructose-6-phosphate 1-phosphotransferase [Sorangium cellulosum]
MEAFHVVTSADLAIKDLGPCRYPSPVAEKLGEKATVYVGEADKVLFDDRLSTVLAGASGPRPPAFELAGPRNRVFWDPREMRAGIVTCGGLCPGVNNVIRGLVLTLAHSYGVQHVFGFRYGYEGLVARFGHAPMRLDPGSVEEIHRMGGTVLGTSRGNQDPRQMVDTLVSLGINVLFVVGGDGTIRGAMSIVRAIEERRLPIGVIGVPKTIDNDIHFIDRSFGFESAFAAAVDVIRSAHVEASGAKNGIGLVKLMGRHSGFIACTAALASADVDVVLIPEVRAELEGPCGLLAHLERRLARHGNAVVVVAEGALQEHCSPSAEPMATDLSGNVKLKDIGLVLRDRINAYFRTRGVEATLKYLDPSYHIRSVPASPSDSVYCWNMARNAAHAAMAGNTEMLIGRWHGRFVHVPMSLAVRMRKQVEPTDDLWMAVVEATGQPLSFS